MNVKMVESVPLGAAITSMAFNSTFRTIAVGSNRVSSAKTSFLPHMGIRAVDDDNCETRPISCSIVHELIELIFSLVLDLQILILMEILKK
jgi:hypothetical protein